MWREEKTVRLSYLCGLVIITKRFIAFHSKMQLRNDLLLSRCFDVCARFSLRKLLCEEFERIDKII